MEDEILEALETTVTNKLADARMISYMFDGAVMQLNADDFNELEDLLVQVGSKFGVVFTASKF